MPADLPELVDIRQALRAFAFPSDSVQTSRHIRRVHWYTASRLVIEGGFHPDLITPRPPFRVVKRGQSQYLHHEPMSAKPGEQTVLGGLKTKQVDVTVSIPGIGPVVAVSLKGVHNAFRNLTNRMEEAAGDCTNLHMAYPALVYGYWCVLRANEETDESPIAHFRLDESGAYCAADLAVTRNGELAEGVHRFAHALVRLSNREDLRDEPSRYEACGLTLVSCVGGPNHAGVYGPYPGSGGELDYNHMFRRLYDSYDERFVYQAPALKSVTRRLVWHPSSPILENTILGSEAFSEMRPRVGL